MPNFQAKTKEETKGDLYPIEAPLQPGEEVPVADPEGLRELGATEFFPRSHEYRHKHHALADLMRPGYFSGEARERLREGDEIYYVLRGGEKIPSQWVRGICVVEEIPSSRELPVILAGIVQLPQATPWRK